MSLGLQATKRRIASVNSTKKITKAMQLVATAKLKSMKNAFSSSNEYVDELAFMTSSLLKRLTDEEKNLIISSPKDFNESTCHIIVTSSLGLCGGYNYNVIKHVADKINKEKDYLIIIGQKGVSYFKNRKYHVDDSHVNILNDFDIDSVDSLIKHILYLYSSGKVNKIELCYTHYKNQITFEPESFTLYPIDKIEGVNRELTRKEQDMLVEPDVLSIMKIVFPLYLKTIIYHKLNESLLSEYASRRKAMENATDNAEEIVSKLQIEFNKARQAAITQEITEVIGGANASK